MMESMEDEDISKTMVFNEKNITTKIDAKGNHNIEYLCFQYVTFWLRATSLALLLYYYNSVRF